MKTLCIDLFCGLGGWAEGFIAEGYDVVGFDNERRPYPGQLVLQDVLTLHGSQFRNAAVIVASPPCQAYSYRAMPWNKGWLAFSVMDDDGSPPVDHRVPDPIYNDLFRACFRIQREASEAAGRHIPLVVENVKGAQPWIGRAAWHFGSFYLWGDVPTLMPFAKHEGRNYGIKNGNRDESYRLTVPRPASDSGLKCGGKWFGKDNPSLMTRFSSKSSARRQMSAEIAKIPFPLAQHIARVFKPDLPQHAPQPK